MRARQYLLQIILEEIVHQRHTVIIALTFCRSRPEVRRSSPVRATRHTQVTSPRLSPDPGTVGTSQCVLGQSCATRDLTNG